MKNFLLKPFRWAIVYSLFLALSVTFVLLDTFVIPRASAPAVTSQATETAQVSGEAASATASAAQQTDSTQSSAAQDFAVITDNSYSDNNIQITIETVRGYDTTFYVADIQVSDPEYLKAALADNTYGRNIKQTTSEMAESNGAIFAINGDYYGFRDSGYVLRNGVLYRDISNQSGVGEDLVIDSQGNLSIISEGDTSAQTLADEGAWQVFSFGPALISDGEITVTKSSEVSQSKSSNPRTAIGQISALHYIIIVSDGRTDESAGLSLLELAQEMSDRGCTVAYNLDGGGSSTMWFSGSVVNNPTNGRSSSERSVSDIVYFGY